MNNTTDLQAPPSSADVGAKELAEERRRLERRDWWVCGYSIFVILLLTFAVISLTLPALLTGAETIFRIKLTEVVFGLITFIFGFYIFFNSYVKFILILRRS